MRRFFSNLEYSVVSLWTSADIVQHSFLVQNSISPLNLELCQPFMQWDGVTDSSYPSFSYSKETVNTEEKCRKIFTKSRNLLYTLHLDLPIGREWSLKNESLPNGIWCDAHTNPHIAKIETGKIFYPKVLHHLIDYACRHSDDNLKVLKWFIKCDDKFVFYQLPDHILNYFSECMHPRLDDPEFVTECFRKLDLIPWLLSSHASQPGRVSNIVYQFHLNGREIDNFVIEEFIRYCLHLTSFQHVRDVLKLKNAPNLCDDDIAAFYLDKVLRVRESMIPRQLTQDMRPQRRTLLHHVYWVYFYKSDDTNAASELLLLIWNSVPDSFLTSDEIATAFAEGIDSSEISDINNFYSEAVGRLHPNNVPRTLQHYSRTVIRRTLCQNGHWLPDAIKELYLPKILKSYLNLE